MSRLQVTGTSRMTRFPRVSGDEPKTATARQPHFKFSPRERG